MSEPIDPVALRPSYSAFLEGGPAPRILLTGHSHQAWPDVAREGLLLAFADAATHVDDKWGAAMEAAGAVRQRVAEWFGGDAADVALAQNSHELLFRFLSALDWSSRRHIVSTDGEFHSLSRQLRRLEEQGVEVTRVPTAPLDTLASRLAEAVREDTIALMCSTVLFETSSVVPGLEEACEAAHNVGAEVLLDAYHHQNVVPWRPIDPRAFVTGGGYKYAQWGEGCCFMRVPKDCELRPVHTGWFADFGGLSGDQTGRVRYGSGGGSRFAGSTYDPSSHYRARAVIEFFDQKELSVPRLRELSLRQTARLMEALHTETILTPREDALRGGFVTVQVDDAPEVARRMRQKGVFVDARRDRLRFGPAPYTTDDELDEGVRRFRECLS
ncbi:MAG: aminotransferase class V-fold PLP-dependent enzyme [Deltaproteobacteria bacterium]|nr:aminotransferase class V-fold PLP-dependent enzyme [Deltaproteobacteria bacterium]